MIQPNPFRSFPGHLKAGTWHPGPGNRNFTLGQDGTAYQFRFRSTTTDANGNGNYLTVQDAVETRLTHIAYTRDRDGLAKMYIEGVLKGEAMTTGTTAAWDPSYRLGLSNELSANRPWLGELHRVAIYSYALTPDEVAANFAAGANAPPPTNLQPVTLSNLTRTASSFRFDFTTTAGRKYVVEFRDDLQQGAWAELQTINGNGAVQSASDANATVPVRFYRVRTE